MQQQSSSPSLPESSPLLFPPLRRNHIWTSAETDHLVSILHRNKNYQVALLPGRITKEQEKVSESQQVNDMQTDV
jgi:hypothetical protein